MKTCFFILILLVSGLLFPTPPAHAEILAGAARVEITHPDHPASDNPPFVKALVVTDESSGTHAVIVAVDAVAIAEIGSIRDPYLANVRARLKTDLGIAPESVLVNASHCHSVVCKDIEDRTVQAVTEAWKAREPVRISAGTGREERIMENRRMKRKGGGEIDVRHAYSLPPDSEIEAVGPVDPEIGIVRLDRVSDGTPLGLLFHFSVHPIQGDPEGKNTADLSGFAAKVIEETLGDGVVALFLQGCGGDINPANYKEVDQPRDARPLGQALGISTLRGARELNSADDPEVSIVNETLAVPRADHSRRIAEMEKEIDALVDSFKGTTLNFETFFPLYVKYHVNGETPATFAQRYLQDEVLGIGDWKNLDANNRKNLEAYVRNIHLMEELTRKQINLALLKKHQARYEAAGSDTVEVEVVGLRLGDFRLVTFPGEVTIPIGLGLKKRSPHPLSFVSGYTNGYLYYSPTAEQLKNRGGAQEDSDCLLAPEWQAIFEAKAMEILGEL